MDGSTCVVKYDVNSSLEGTKLDLPDPGNNPQAYKFTGKRTRDLSSSHYVDRSNGLTHATGIVSQRSTGSNTVADPHSGISGTTNLKRIKEDNAPRCRDTSTPSRVKNDGKVRKTRMPSSRRDDHISSGILLKDEVCLTPVRGLPSSTLSASTPVRTKRSYTSSPVTSVESEFCRIYSSKVSPARDDRNLSFLFRGATKDISTSTVGMYGEINIKSLSNICNVMKEYGLDEKSVVLDLGSGRGIPNFLFSRDANAFSSIGVEKCPVAYLSSVHNIYTLLSRDISKIKTELNTPQRDGYTTDDTPLCSTKTHIVDADLPELNSVQFDDAETPDLYAAKIRKYNNTHVSSAESSSFPLKFPDTTSEVGLPHSSTIGGTGEVGGSSLREVFKAGRDEGYPPLDFDTCTPARSYPNIDDVFEEFKSRTSSRGIAFVNEDMTAYDSFEGVTHFYSFDVAMEKALINNMVYQFKNTSTAWVFASFIGDLITKYDLNDCFIAARVSAKMFGSGEGRSCYIYVKNDWERIKKRHDSTILEKLQNNNDGNPSNFVYNGKININQFHEPLNTLDLIKLSKLPLYSQCSWYLDKIEKMTRPVVTRAYSDASLKLREQLSKQRDELIEKLASCNNRDAVKLREELKTHISTHFKIHKTFP